MSPAKLNTAFKAKDTSIENIISKNLPEYFIRSTENRSFRSTGDEGVDIVLDATEEIQQYRFTLYSRIIRENLKATQLNSKTLHFLTAYSNTAYFFLKSQKLKTIKYNLGNNLLIAILEETKNMH
jgi:hypothetical protein